MPKTKLAPDTKRDTTTEIIKSSKTIMNKVATESLNINASELEKIQQNIIGVNSVVEDIVELIPEIDVIIEIVTSLILAPNDMESVNLNYDLSSLGLPSEITTNVIDVLEDHLETEYNFIEKLETIVSESLYTKGAYVELNLPVSFINDLVKQTKTKRMSVGIESAIKDYEKAHEKINIVDSSKHITITNSLATVCKDNIIKDRVTAGIEDKYYSGIIGDTNIKTLKPGIEGSSFSDGFAALSDFTLNDNKSITKKVDVSNIIPICRKDDPSEHYGYFYFTFDNKFKETKTRDDRYIEEVFTEIKDTLMSTDKNVPEIKNIDSLRQVLIVERLDKYITKLKLDDGVDLTVDVEETLLLDIAEHMLQQLDLKIIFLPKEFVSYYAVNFRKNGTGKSLIERVSVLASIKGMLTFVNLLAFIKSSVSTTEVKIDLDEDDINYRSTLDKVLAGVIKNRQFKLPVRMLKVDNYIDWIDKLGYVVDARHPDFPEINVEVKEVKNNINPIDTTLFEALDKQIYISLYANPELINESYDTEFATVARQKDILLNKRVKKLQRKYDKLITKDISKKLMLDGLFIGKLRTILTSNIKSLRKSVKNSNTILPDTDSKNVTDEVLVNRTILFIIRKLKVELVKPESTVKEIRSDEFENFTDILDTTMDKIFSGDALPDDLVGELSDNLDNIKAAVKTVLIKRYMADNKILPDFNKMFALNEDGVPNADMLDEHLNFVETLKMIALPFIKESNKLKNKTDEELSKLDDPEEEEESNIVDDNDVDNNNNNTGNNDSGKDIVKESDEVDDDEVTEPEEKEKDNSKDNENSEDGFVYPGLD